MRSALADFQSEISRIDKVADWLITPDALESKMMPATVAIRCGAVVLLSGYFETFLKRLHVQIYYAGQWPRQTALDACLEK